MSSNANVTVVISCFNLSAYILTCIDSVLKQDYKGQVTILIGDDASTDTSVTLIKALLVNNPNITLVERSENIGTAANVIDLYQCAKDDYIVHLDGDDIMLEGRLKTTVSYLEAHDDVDLVCCELIRFYDESGENCGLHYQDHYQKKNFQHRFTLQTLVEHGSYILPSSLTFRKSLVSRLKLVNEIVVIDDYLRHLQLMLSAKNGVVLDEVLTRYRVRSNGSTGLMQTEHSRRIQSLNDMVLARKTLLPEESVSIALINKGIAGEYFAASLFFLRKNMHPEFKLCMKDSFNEAGCFYSLKHRLLYCFYWLPSFCKLLI